MATDWIGLWLDAWGGAWDGEDSQTQPPAAISPCGPTPLDIALQGLASPFSALSAATHGVLTDRPCAHAHTSGGGGGVQSAQRRRLRERADEEDEIAMVMAVLAQIGVFA